MSARIIPFPVRGAASASEPAPAERLDRALKRLEQALAAQREAVATWRAALGSLHGTVRDLGQGLQAYRGNLEGLQTKVRALNRQATRMEHWADTVLAARDTRAGRQAPTRQDCP